MQANTSVIALATIIGALLLTIPNKHHIKVPNAKSEYITSEMPEVFLVLIVFTACGINERVVKKAAMVPIIVT